MALQLLSSATVDSIVSEEDVVTVESNAKVTRVIDLMVEHNLVSLPVLDASTRRLVGMVDMVDIVTYVVDLVGVPLEKDASTSWYLQQCEDAGLKSQTNDQIAGISKKNKLCPVTSGTSLLEAMKVMAEHHVQRLPVVAVDFQVKSIITQSAIIAFLHKNIDSLGDFADKSLVQLGFNPKEVISVSVEKLTIDAFRILSEKKISGIPVMDTDGTMITNLSCSDLRDVATDPKLFEYLRLPLDSFIPVLKSKINIKKESSMNVMYPKISCHFDTTLRTVLGKLAATKIHRIYVTDSQDAPVGIVSLIDIIEKVVAYSKR